MEATAHIQPNELSRKEYCKVHNISNPTLSLRIRENRVNWRYLFPETKEYVVIESDIATHETTIKPNEVSIKTYKKLKGYKTVHAVYEQIRKNTINFRYLFPESKEYLLIDISTIQDNCLTYQLVETSL